MTGYPAIQVGLPKATAADYLLAPRAATFRSPIQEILRELNPFARMFRDALRLPIGLNMARAMALPVRPAPPIRPLTMVDPTLIRHLNGQAQLERLTRDLVRGQLPAGLVPTPVVAAAPRPSAVSLLQATTGRASAGARASARSLSPQPAGQQTERTAVAGSAARPMDDGAGRRGARRPAPTAVSRRHRKPVPPMVDDLVGIDFKPDPITATSSEQLLMLLVQFWRWAGGYSVRRIADGSGGALSHATVHRLLTGTAGTRLTQEYLVGIVRGCGGNDLEVQLWVAAWRSLTTQPHLRVVRS